MSEVNVCNVYTTGNIIQNLFFLTFSLFFDFAFILSYYLSTSKSKFVDHIELFTFEFALVMGGQDEIIHMLRAWLLFPVSLCRISEFLRLSSYFILFHIFCQLFLLFYKWYASFCIYTDAIQTEMSIKLIQFFGAHTHTHTKALFFARKCMRHFSFLLSYFNMFSQNVNLFPNLITCFLQFSVES